MPFGRLGYARADVLEAERYIAYSQQLYCAALERRPRKQGLPAHLVPPKNAILWQPSGAFVLPIAPDGTDQLVFTERVPLGYDGVLIAQTNEWNKGGFVEGSGTITWRVKQDRRFIPYLDTILTTRGRLTVPFDRVGQGIPLLSGQDLSYFVNFAIGSAGVLDGGGQVNCALTGYIWPRWPNVGYN